MNVHPVVVAVMACLLPGCASAPVEPVTHKGDGALGHFVDASIEDHRRHYRTEALLDLLPPFAVAGTLANSHADEWLRDSWQDDVRTDAGDEVSRVLRHFGDVAQLRPSVPLYVLTMAIGNYEGDAAHDGAMATWAARSLRANIIGAPQVWILSNLLGSPRPPDGPSRWQVLEDDNAVSGHAFHGAVPLLTAARMIPHEGWRTALYVTSTLPALSRVNDDRHYASQAVLGWSLAWLATRTVARVDDDGNDIAWLPLVTADGAYVVLRMEFP